MQSGDVIRVVTAHIESGGNAKIAIDKHGRRYVKLIKWGFLGPKHEISGATEVKLQRLFASRGRTSSR